MKKENRMTDAELDMVPHFRKLFRRRVGKHNSISSTSIMEYMYYHGHVMNGGAQVRKIINYIRINRLVKNLVACNRGYYVERRQTEVANYVVSLRVRANEILQVAKSYN